MLLAGLYDCAFLDGKWTQVTPVIYGDPMGSLLLPPSLPLDLHYSNQGTLGSAEPLWSFTIVTTSACKDFTWLHDRQPVVLSSRYALDTWLDTSSQAWTSALTRLVEPYDNSVSPLVWYALVVII